MKIWLSGALLIAAVLVPMSGAVQNSRSDYESIRALVRAFADARNAHDGGAVAALYAEDGEWISEAQDLHVKGRAELASMWGKLTGEVERSIQTIDLPGPNIAVVRVDTQYGEPTGLHHEAFILSKYRGEWRIQIHQSLP